MSGLNRKVGLIPTYVLVYSGRRVFFHKVFFSSSSKNYMKVYDLKQSVPPLVGRSELGEKIFISFLCALFNPSKNFAGEKRQTSRD